MSYIILIVIILSIMLELLLSENEVKINLAKTILKIIFENKTI
jgi:hypothetical protein